MAKASTRPSSLGINKRQTGRWSIAGSLSKRWNQDQDTAYFGQNLRTVTTPSTPNDFINTDDGRSCSACGPRRSTAATSSVAGPRHPGPPLPVGAALRPHDLGLGGLRDRRLGGINYGTQRILMEPLGTRKQDDIAIFDLRAEKYFNLPSSRRVGVFFDVYNLTNTDAARTSPGTRAMHSSCPARSSRRLSRALA